MDDDNGTDIPGEGIPGQGKGTAGQRRPGPKPAARTRKTAARPARPAQAPTQGQAEGGTPEVAPATGKLTEGQGAGSAPADPPTVELGAVPTEAPADGSARTAPPSGAKKAATKKTAAKARKTSAAAAPASKAARPTAAARAKKAAAAKNAEATPAAGAPEPRGPVQDAPAPQAAAGTEPVPVRLPALLQEKGALAPEAALAVLKGSLLGLTATPGRYDPANVVITTEGTVHLADAEAADNAEETGDSAASGIHAATATFSACLTGTPGAEQPASEVPEPVQPLLAHGLADDPGQRPQSAADFAAELDAVAVAAYGEDWEKRGQDELAALVGALAAAAAEDKAVAAVPPVPVIVPLVSEIPAETAGAGAPGFPPPPGYGPTPAGGEPPAPRFGRRAKILAVTAAAVIIAGAVAVTAVATGNKDDNSATVDPTPTAVTSLTSTATSPAATPSPTLSLSTSPTATASSTPTGTATPTRTVSSTPTVTPSKSPTTAPTTPSADPTRTTGSTGGPHVSSIAVTGFTCSTGKKRTATATVYVTYDGTAAGTLHLTWWRSATGRPQGAITLAPQTAQFPKGAQNYTFTDKFTFTPDRDHPYIGLSVSSDPAAASGNGTFGVGCH